MSLLGFASRAHGGRRRPEPIPTCPWPCYYPESIPTCPRNPARAEAATILASPGIERIICYPSALLRPSLSPPPSPRHPRALRRVWWWCRSSRTAWCAPTPTPTPRLRLRLSAPCCYRCYRTSRPWLPQQLNRWARQGRAWRRASGLASWMLASQAAHSTAASTFQVTAAGANLHTLHIHTYSCAPRVWYTPL